MEKKEVIELVKACMEACLERYAVPGMLSVEETAEKLGISKDTVRDYLRKGELTGYEIGNRMMRVSVQSINELLERVKTGKPETEETEKTDLNGGGTQAAAEEPKGGNADAAAEEAATLARAEEQKTEEQKAEEPKEVKPEEVKPEKAKPEEFERCTAVHPKNGKRCVLFAGHEGKHRCE